MPPKRPADDADAPGAEPAAPSAPSHIYIVWEEVEEDEEGHPNVKVHGARRTAQAAVELAKARLPVESDTSALKVDLKGKVVCTLPNGSKVEKFKLGPGEPSRSGPAPVPAGSVAGAGTSDDKTPQSTAGPAQPQERYHAFVVTAKTTDYYGDRGKGKLAGVSLSTTGAAELAHKKLPKDALRPIVPAKWPAVRNGGVVLEQQQQTGFKKGYKYCTIYRFDLADYHDAEEKKRPAKKSKKE